MSTVDRVRIAAAALFIALASTAGATCISYQIARADPYWEIPGLVVASPADPGFAGPIVQSFGVDMTPPSDSHALPPPVLHDPIVAPLQAFDDAEAARKVGWPALVLAGCVMLAMAARTLGKKWPDVAWLAWLNTGKRAFVIGAVVTVGSAAFDVLIMGGTPMAVAFAAFASVMAVLSAEGK